MSDFFTGWRRKIGCVTLLMASLFTTVWLRSLTITDTVEHWGSFTRQNWRSLNGVFQWSGGEHGRVIPRATRGRFVWQHYEIDPELGFEIGNRWRKRWYWDRLGIYFWRQQEPFEAFEFNIRYSSLVIPLTLLSAFLLLSKPRKSTPKKITEPTPAEGP